MTNVNSNPSPRRHMLIQAMLLITLACGGIQFAYGLAAPELVPRTQLDAMLTDDERSDPAARERTLGLLRCSAGSYSRERVLWTVVGAIVAAASLLGLAVLNSAKSSRP